MKEAMYLKINRSEEFAFRNLSRWIDVATLIDADCFILCDNSNLIDRIHNEILLSQMCVFISSDKGLVNQKIVENIANRNWMNAAYAHITTFTHAKGKKYDTFWNIDADDTMVCLTVDRMVELLQNVEIYADKNGIDCFSMDMWRTKWEGQHWSFGITYINGRLNWIGELLKYCEDNEYKTAENGMNYNIDCFFTYLKCVSKIKIETFYIENLKFIHYSNDFFKGLISSAFYHWKNGKLLFPIMRECVGINEIASYNIYSDVIKLDIGITDEEAKNILTYYSKDGCEFRGYVNWNNIINRKLFSIKKKLYMQSYNENCQIICFGAGKCFDNNIEKILGICELKYVCDNDSTKWGKDLGNGIECISPSELKGMKNILVVILIYSHSVAMIIARQLEEMGITKYDFVENFLRCVE